MKQFLPKILLSSRQQRALENCRTMETIFHKLQKGFGSTQEALESLRRLETVILKPDATSPETSDIQRELLLDYPNIAVAFRAWHELQLAEFQTRQFPIQAVIDHLNGVEIVLRRIHPRTDEDVLRVFHRLGQTKQAILATALTADHQQPPLQALADLTLCLQIARLATTTPSARPDWLPEIWKLRPRETLAAVAMDIWKEAHHALAAAPNWSARLKLYFLISARWTLETFLSDGRLSAFRKIDLAFDETVKLLIELARDPISAASHPEMNSIVRHQLARISRSLPDVRLAITNMKLNGRSLGTPNTSRLEPTDVDTPDNAPTGPETTSS